MRELYPGAEFQFSPGRFDRFKVRNKISYCQATNVAQQQPVDHEEKIRKFHLEIRWVAASETTEGPLGKSNLSTIANVDQTLLPFTLNKGQGYDQKGTKQSGTVEHNQALTRGSAQSIL